MLALLTCKSVYTLYTCISCVASMFDKNCKLIRHRQFALISCFQFYLCITQTLQPGPTGMPTLDKELVLFNMTELHAQGQSSVLWIVLSKILKTVTLMLKTLEWSAGQQVPDMHSIIVHSHTFIVRSLYIVLHVFEGCNLNYSRFWWKYLNSCNIFKAVQPDY